MELILVRHGETTWNKERRVQGRSDIELSEVGLEQARKLALALKDYPLEAIYASPLTRARQTAEAINAHHHLHIRIDAGLMEMDQGDFEGLSFKELMACEKEFLQQWISDPSSVTMPNGESFIQVQQRAWRVIEDMAGKPENVLVVSHNFTIAAIVCKLRNISLSEFRSGCVDTASKTIIHINEGEPSFTLFNDRSHLREQG
ncbi:MAG: histidine phosphatase family protein [Syntrophales bacterium]|nr:histidine phosphatase family protein [Syntrophales bacterium]